MADSSGTTRQRLSYWVWGSAGLVIAIPEISAAVSGRVPWPTISATVGHLEARWAWVAIIVVGLIVFGAFRATELVLSPALPGRPLPGEELPGQGLPEGPERTKGGRLIVAPRRQPDESDRPVSPYWLLVGAVIAVAVLVVGVVVAVQRPQNNRFLVGYVLYGLIAAFWIVLPSVLAGLFRREVPFLGLFQTVGQLDRIGRHGHLVVLVILGGLAVLLIHLALYPWPAIIADLQHLHQPPTPASP